MSLVPELGALGSNEGGARATGSSTLSFLPHEIQENWVLTCESFATRSISSPEISDITSASTNKKCNLALMMRIERRHLLFCLVISMNFDIDSSFVP